MASTADERLARLEAIQETTARSIGRLELVVEALGQAVRDLAEQVRTDHALRRHEMDRDRRLMRAGLAVLTVLVAVAGVVVPLIRG